MSVKREALILQPIHHNTTDILRCFVASKPLSSAQQNFLAWHHRQLSSSTFDPIYKYYIESAKKSSAKSFLMPSEAINQQSVQTFKKRLALFIKTHHASFSLHFTEKQFNEFKAFNIPELIFWHGNQFLSGAPFFPGGIPPVIYFQWGNYFGVAKYVFVPGEKALKANILVYFEAMQERHLQQCVADYEKKLQLNVEQQHRILNEQQLAPHAYEHFLIKTPRLNLTPQDQANRPYLK